MYLQLTDLLWLTLIAAGLLFWYSGLSVRERALKAVKQHCDQMDLQLLDQTIAMRSLWLKRDVNGQLRLLRRYNFEFTSTGDERYQGYTIFIGNRLESITTQAHRLG